MRLLGFNHLKYIFIFSAFLSVFVVFSVRAQQIELRDPTRPNIMTNNDTSLPGDNADVSQVGGITLSGIVIQPGVRVAILNGQRVLQGESWQGFNVSQVGFYHVLLKNDETELTIRLSNSIDIKTVRSHEL